MTQEIDISNAPAKKRDLQELYQAIEKMDEAGRSFIAGAIAFAGSSTRKAESEN